jgi:hypothetical protein
MSCISSMNKAIPTPRSAATDPAPRHRHVDSQLADRGDPRGSLGGLGVPGEEGLEHAEEVVDPLRGPVSRCQLPHRHVQRAADRPADRLLGPGLDLPRSPQPLHRHGTERVEQHRLAHAAQAGQDHAAFWPAASDALQDDFKLSQFPVPAG